VMLRLVQADVLKLRRRRGMVGIVAVIVFAAIGIYYFAGGDDFDTAVGLLTLLATVAGAIFGSTAGGQDLETGVFRDLVATGRSRTALFAARFPAACALTFAILVPALVASALLLHPSDLVSSSLSVLVSGALSAAICVGLAALIGRSGPVMGLAIAFQIGVAPLLAQVEALGNARFAIPAVAVSRLGGPDGLVSALPLLGAIAIILAWAAAGLGGGLWRTRTQEI
jgi:hypothetical protein